MTVLLLLIAVSIALALVGLGAFLWALRNDQFEDLDGGAERVLLDDDGPAAIPSAADEPVPASSTRDPLPRRSPPS